MYFSRTGNLIDLIIWLVMSLCWCSGGWLLVCSVFHLRQRERVISGIALGFILFMVFSNLLGYLLNITEAYWGAAILILSVGIFFAFFKRNTFLLNFKPDSLTMLCQLAAFMGIFYLYALINRGLAIFDDFYNLPLVSRIAAGDFPPHYFLYPDKPMPLHYGLHLIGASLVRIAGFFPWSAFDLSKAFSQALLVMLAWLWFRRCTHSKLAAFMGSVLILFGGGARWLLRLLPHDIIVKGGEQIHLMGSGANSGHDLLSAIHNPWNISGAGPIPFPFAFANGLFPPATMAFGSSGAMLLVTIFLLLLLGINQKDFLATTLVGCILASLGLTAEHSFVMLWGGILLALAVRYWNQKRRKLIVKREYWISHLWLLGLAAVLAVPFGGVLTEIFRRGLSFLVNGTYETGYGLQGFALRWPPALISAHLGVLSFSLGFQVLVLLFEMGPVFILAPIVTFYYLRKASNKSVIKTGMVYAAIITFLAASMIVYQEREREITRMAALALSIWMILGFPLLWKCFKKGNLFLKTSLGLGYLITICGGVVMFSIEYFAAQHPQLSDFISQTDAIVSKQYWNKLPEDAQILDRIPYRAITIFGRTCGKAYSDNYSPTAEWQSLISNLDPVKAAKMGYQYIYFDNIWHRKLSSREKENLANNCIEPIEKIVDIDIEKEFRVILDIQHCNPEESSP